MHQNVAFLKFQNFPGRDYICSLPDYTLYAPAGRRVGPLQSKNSAYAPGKVVSEGAVRTCTGRLFHVRTEDTRSPKTVGDRVSVVVLEEQSEAAATLDVDCSSCYLEFLIESDA